MVSTRQSPAASPLPRVRCKWRNYCTAPTGLPFARSARAGDGPVSKRLRVAPVRGRSEPQESEQSSARTAGAGTARPGATRPGATRPGTAGPAPAAARSAAPTRSVAPSRREVRRPRRRRHRARHPPSRARRPPRPPRRRPRAASSEQTAAASPSRAASSRRPSRSSLRAGSWWWGGKGFVAVSSRGVGLGATGAGAAVAVAGMVVVGAVVGGVASAEALVEGGIAVTSRAEGCASGAGGPMTRRASARSARSASSDEAAGHFAWEQAAHEYGGLVADWVSGGYGRCQRQLTVPAL